MIKRLSWSNMVRQLIVLEIPNAQIRHYPKSPTYYPTTNKRPKHEQKNAPNYTLPLDLWGFVWSFIDTRSHFTTLPLISTKMRTLGLTQRASWPPMPQMPRNITNSLLRNIPFLQHLKSVPEKILT